MRKSLKKLIAAVAASALALSMGLCTIPNTASAEEISKAGKKAAKAKVDLDGTYHVYFGFQQTESWIFRDTWYNPKSGLDGSEFKNGVSFSDFVTTRDVDDPSSSDAKAIEGTTVTDAEITGNGVYTVGVEGLDGVLTDVTEAQIAMLYLSTDIPYEGKDKIVISDVILKTDGMEQTLPEELSVSEDAKSVGLYRLDLVNSYARDKGEYPDSPTLMAPNDSIQITFTVSGMNSDNPDAVAPVEEPAETPATDDSASVDKEEESSKGPIIAIVIVAIVVIAGVGVIVVKKKKN